MPDSDEQLAYRAMSTFFGAIACTIVGLDDLPQEHRTTATFIRCLDELLADLPNLPKGSEICSRVDVLRQNLELDIDKARVNRELLKNPQ